MAGPRSLKNLCGHVVICNCNPKVGKIVEELHTGAICEPPDVVLIIQDEALWQAHPKWHPPASAGNHFFAIAGCPTDENDLRKVGIRDARAAVILADPNQGELADAPSTLTAMAIEKQNPQVHTVIELVASGNRRLMKATDVNEVICMREISEKLIVQSSLNPGIKNIFEDILTFRRGTSQLYTLTVPPHLAQLTYRQLAEKMILSDAPFILIGFVTANQSAKPETGADNAATRRSVPKHADTVTGGAMHSRFSQIVINPRANLTPGKDTVLTTEDRLVIIGHEHPDLERV